MIEGQIPKNETQRIEKLKSYQVLDTLPEEEYDAITQIASQICDTPIALVSLIDEKRQWFKSHHGLPVSETPREFAFCAHAINEPDEIFMIPDATKDERFHDNPLTTDDPHVIFYAGAPLKTSDGYPLGTLCVIDTKPRESLSEGQKESLKALAKQVISQLELRRKNRELTTANNEITRLNSQLNHFAYRLTHDLKSPARGIKSLIDLINIEHAEDITSESLKHYLSLIDSRSMYMDTLIEEIFEFTRATNLNASSSEFNIDEKIRYILSNCDVETPLNLELVNCNHKIKLPEISFLQVIQNLLTNSKKFTDKSESSVKITFSSDEEFDHFIYEDDGPGIPEKYWHKAFVMFETLGDKSYENSGVGLATVKSIMKRLGGDISLKKRKDNQRGIRFDFYFPKLV